MSVLAGERVELRIGNGAMPNETFTTTGGVQLIQFQLQHEMVRRNVVSDGVWHHALSGAGVRQVRITIQGVFTDSLAEVRLRDQSLAGSTANYELIFANGDTLTGAFIITRYDRAANIDDVELFEAQLESAGALEYVSS